MNTREAIFALLFVVIVVLIVVSGIVPKIMKGDASLSQIVDSIIPDFLKKKGFSMGNEDALLQCSLNDKTPEQTLREINTKYGAIVAKAASDHEVSKCQVLSHIAVESRGDPKAVSKAKAVGLMQLMPATAIELGLNVEDKCAIKPETCDYTSDERLNPEKNIDKGTLYLGESLPNQLKEKLDLSYACPTNTYAVVGSYNAGAGTMYKHLTGGADLPGETATYICRVKKYMDVCNSKIFSEGDLASTKFIAEPKQGTC